MASGMACTHCSRAPYAGHHVDCPDNPDRAAAAAEDKLDRDIAAAAVALAVDVDAKTIAEDRLIARTDIMLAFCAGAEFVREASKKVTP